MNKVGKTTSQLQPGGSATRTPPDDAACCAPITTARSISRSEPAVADRSRLADLADGSGAEALAERLKALADPTRLRMLALLAEHSQPLCVCEITPLFKLHQPTISHHLRLLRVAGLANCERRGTWAYYWATEAGVRTLSLVASLA